MLEKRERGWEYYKIIKTCLEGLYEILEMTNSEDSVYFLCGLDNLIQLKEVTIDLLSNIYTPREIRMKLREAEFNIKKNIFFDKCSKEIKLK